MADEEFRDEIDWSAVDLPSISASIVAALRRPDADQANVEPISVAGHPAEKARAATPQQRPYGISSSELKHNNNNKYRSGNFPGGSCESSTSAARSMAASSNSLSGKSSNEEVLLRQVRVLCLMDINVT